MTEVEERFAEITRINIEIDRVDEAMKIIGKAQDKFLEERTFWSYIVDIFTNRYERAWEKLKSVREYLWNKRMLPLFEEQKLLINECYEILGIPIKVKETKPEEDRYVN